MMEVNIERKDYTQNLIQRKTILKEIMFRLRPGNSVLVIGGSGCGKSTLVHCLLNETNYKGKINVGSETVGYVSQNDVLDQRESLYNSIYYTTKLCNSNLPEKDIISLTERTIKKLSLNHVKQNNISELSGGQRKRCQVAQQLVRKNNVILFDEADTGLDALTTYHLLTNITDSAKKDNRIVIAISHNILPENIRLFSHILILAKGDDNIATTAYFGRTNKVYDFFGKSSMLEILTEIQTVEEGGSGHGQYYIDKYKISSKKEKTIHVDKITYSNKTCNDKTDKTEPIIDESVDFMLRLEESLKYL